MSNILTSPSVIKDLSPFKFWCQKVLPSVYDDSLSYYELLNKVVAYINDSIDNINILNTNVNNLYEAFVTLENYVNHYFDTADFQQLVDNKLDEMAVDGTLAGLINPLISDYLDDMIFKNDLNKEYFVEVTEVGEFTHSTTQIQGMTTDGNKLYACGTSGDTTQVHIYEINPSTLVTIDHPLSLYGHPNSADYCNGKLYITGCVSSAGEADYNKLTVVNMSDWSVEIKSLPSNLKWWSVALLKAYNNKHILAGHRAESGIVDLYATVYGDPENAPAGYFGYGKFMPWRSIDIGAFACDPTGMCQYGKYILIGDAHLSNMFSHNALRVITTNGDYKATVYLPEMGTNELEDVCVIGNTIYTCDINGNIYTFSLNGILNKNYDSHPFAENGNAGLQFFYVNENGGDDYTELTSGAKVHSEFRMNPWFFPSKHWITGGQMIVRSGNDRIPLSVKYEGDGTIIFNGAGRSGKALVYLNFVYTRTSDANEYIYTLTTFTATAHYEGTETNYTSLEDFDADGYLTGYTYVMYLWGNAIPRFTDVGITLS